MNDLRKLITLLPRHLAEKHFTKGTRSEFLGNDTVLCQILGNKKFYAIASDVGLTPHLLFDGYWEFWLTLHFAKMVKPGDTVIDIGANLGYYTILAADLVGSTGSVLAVEPNPVVFRHLTNSIRVNGYASRANAANIAIGAAGSVERAPFFVPEGEPKNGRFFLEGESAERLAKRGAVFDVAVGSIDPDKFEKVDFIKIDVEGAEIQVLRHLQPLVERFSPHVVCEVNFGRRYTYADVQEALGTSRELKFLDYDGGVKTLTKSMAENERLGDDWLVCHG